MNTMNAAAIDPPIEKSTPRLDPNAVSITDLVYNLRSAVQTALRKTNEYGIASPGISILPAPGPIIGISLKQRDFGDSKISDFMKLAREVMSHMPEIVETSQPVVLVVDRKVIIGFLLSQTFIELRE